MVRCHEPKGSAGYRLGKHKSAETSDITAADRPIVCQLESAVGSHSRPKLAVPAMSGLPPLATGQRTSLEVRFMPILLQKSFWGEEQKFLEPLMRFTRGDVRDHIVSYKIDHGPS